MVGEPDSGSEAASVGESPELRQLDGLRFGRFLSLRFPSDGDQSHSLRTRSGEQILHFCWIADENRSIGEFDKPGVALLDGIAGMPNVVEGNGEQRQTASRSVTRGKSGHSWSASSEDLDIGQSVHEQRVESITHPCVLDTLPTTNDEDAVRHAVSLGVAGVGGDVGCRSRMPSLAVKRAWEASSVTDREPLRATVLDNAADDTASTAYRWAE